MKLECFQLNRLIICATLICFAAFLLGIPNLHIIYYALFLFPFMHVLISCWIDVGLLLYILLYLFLNEFPFHLLLINYKTKQKTREQIQYDVFIFN